MKAMIFAAGLGTRLRPLTDKTPKALLVYQGKTLLEHAVEHLIRYGVDQLIVNIHHHSGQVLDFIRSHPYPGVNIAVSDESGMLLDTGGGLKKAAWFFDDDLPFFVRNVDVISDLDLGKVLDWHRENSALATLVTRKRETSRLLLFDESMVLCGWKNRRSGEKKIVRQGTGKIVPIAFSGIHVIDPLIFSNIVEKGKFPIIDLYLRLAPTNNICGFMDEESSWSDAGKSIKNFD